MFAVRSIRRAAPITSLLRQRAAMVHTEKHMKEVGIVLPEYQGRQAPPPRSSLARVQGYHRRRRRRHQPTSVDTSTTKPRTALTLLPYVLLAACYVPT